MHSMAPRVSCQPQSGTKTVRESKTPTEFIVVADEEKCD